VPEDQRTPSADPLTILLCGELELQGRMPWSSNGTFLATATLDGVTLPAIYKPHRGERPLWDFPGGLYRREVAAYELGRALGWRLVPETVLRPEAPLGIGSVQRMVEADFEQHYFTLLENDAYLDDLRTMATFDLLANNADRKSGHCLVDGAGLIWGIDHGLCFHVEPKLRTVIWDFGGDPIPPSLIDDVRRLSVDGLPEAVSQLLADDERVALTQRLARVASARHYPNPGAGRPYPWPLV